MPLKEFLVKKLSLKLNVSERIINEVITHQFSSAFQATATVNTLEISGFAKFTFSQTKAKKQMVKLLSQKALYTTALEDITITDDKRRNLMMRLASVNKNIEILKPRIHDTK